MVQTRTLQNILVVSIFFQDLSALYVPYMEIIVSNTYTIWIIMKGVKYQMQHNPPWRVFSLLQSTDWLWNKQWKISIINSSSNTCTWWLWDTYNIYNKISKQCTFIWIIHCHNKNKIHTKMYNSYKKCIKRYLKVYSSFEHNVVLNIFAGDNLWNRKSIIQKIAHIAFDQRNECHNQLILKLKVHEHLGCFLKIKLRSRFHLIKAPCILDNYNKSNHHIKS